MNKTTLAKIAAVSTIILTAILGIAQQKKVIQIFRNGEVIKEYPVDFIDYIEVNDKDESTANNPGGGFEMPDAPAQVMRDSIEHIYYNIASGQNLSLEWGWSGLVRALFNLEELPTDEAKWLWVNDQGHELLSFGIVDDKNGWVRNAYVAMTGLVGYCNEFIKRDFNLEYIDDRVERSRAIVENDEYIRQAKILRSGMYFYLISEFGNVPYCDENSDSEAPVQLSDDLATGRRMVTHRVIATLEDIVDWYKANDPSNRPPYGQVGLDVAEALLVKFYLNHEVFTGQAAWDKCLTHARAIISRRGKGGFKNSGLSMNYTQNFSQTNRTAADNEIIWRIATMDSKGNKIPNYSNGGFLLTAFLTYRESFKPSTYNCHAYWQCMAAPRQLSEVFEWNDDYSESPDLRTAWWGTAKHGISIDNPDFDGNNWGKNGFIPIKFTNWNINDDGSVDKSDIPSDMDYMYLDYGMIRLAEIYLSAAEAILHGAGSQEEALRYTNYVRERAGMPAFASLDMETLRAERQRELYTECTRRTDLIRYGLWISGYNWKWKGLSENGCDYDPSFTVYPLPADIVTQYGYTQNPISSSEYLKFNPLDILGAVVQEDLHLYLSGSLQEWANPVIANYSLFKPYQLTASKLRKLSNDSKIYTADLDMPANPEFRIVSSLRGDKSEYFGFDTSTGEKAEFDYSGGYCSLKIKKGGETIKLPEFKGGKLQIVVDMTDPDNITLNLTEMNCLYIEGNVRNPETGLLSELINDEFLYTGVHEKNFRLKEVEGQEDIYMGQYYLVPKSDDNKYSEFYVVKGLCLNGTVYPNCYGPSIHTYGYGVIHGIDGFFEEQVYEAYLYYDSQCGWEIKCEEETPITIVIDMEKNRAYFRKGFHEVTFEERMPIFN